MKKLMILITMAILMVSCDGMAEKKRKRNSNRIQLIESKAVNGGRISIISIDGKLYATSTRGGIVKLNGSISETNNVQ